MKKIEYVVWVLIIAGLAWVLSGLVCSRPLIEPRYICIKCKKPQWQKGMQLSDKQEFICYKGRLNEKGCYQKLYDRAVEELGYPTLEKDGYAMRDGKIAEKIREYLEEGK